MGFLSTAEVIECSASDLIGRYVGHISPKTNAQLERCLSKVLFMEDAHWLAKGDFAAEAATELAHLLSLPKYAGKIVVILTGCSEDMNHLMTARPSLASLVRDEVVFKPMSAEEL